MISFNRFVGIGIVILSLLVGFLLQHRISKHKRKPKITRETCKTQNLCITKDKHIRTKSKDKGFSAPAISRWNYVDVNSLPPVTGLPSSNTTFLTRGGGSNVDRIGFFVGIDYVNDEENRLQTCFNDVVNLSQYVKQTYDYPTGNMVWLTDEHKPLPFGGNSQAPTKANFEAAWRSLVQKAQANDRQGKSTEIFFVFSGHGYAQPSTNLNEMSGEEEMLVLLDGFELDENLCTQFLMPLPSSCRVVIVADCCHSATVCNLPWSYNRISHSLDQESDHTNIQAHICMIAGCRDEQTSASGNSEYDMSELSKAFLKLMKMKGTGKALTAVDLILALRIEMMNRGQKQIPCLSFSRREDLGARIC